MPACMVRVTPAGQTYTYAATWRFSSAAQISLSKFTTTFTTTPFSADSGAWDAGRSNVDGYSGVPSNFWGIGNFRGFDGFECYKVYQNGVSSTEYGTGSTFTLPIIVGIAVGGCALFVFVIYSCHSLKEDHFPAWTHCRTKVTHSLCPFTRILLIIIFFIVIHGHTTVACNYTHYELLCTHTASAPPMVNDPSLSKDINAYFYGDSSHSTSTSHRGNQIVTTDHEAAELGGVGLGLGLGVGQGTNEGYTHTVDSPHSNHRPHPAVSPHYTKGGGGGGSGGSGGRGSSGGGIEMHDMSHHGASPASKSVSAPLSPTSNHNHNQTLNITSVSARESLPVAALAMTVTVDHSHIAHSQDHEIAIAEVYIGEAEEYKE